MPDSPARFSLRTVTGNPGSYPSAPTDETHEAAPAPGGAQASKGVSVPDLDRRDPPGEPIWRLAASSSGAWEAGGSRASVPSAPSQIDLSPGPATGGMGVVWRPPEQAAPPVSRPMPTTGVEPTRRPPGPAPSEKVETFPHQVTEEEASASVSAPDPAPAPSIRKPRQRWQRWDVAVGMLVLLLVSYLGLSGVLYATRLWQARQSNSVTLLQDLGHGGTSQVTVTFEHNHLMVTEIDNDDPQRVTILQVNEAIVLATDKTVLEAWFQAVLQPSRLDLVIQMDGGLDWPPYHPQFTTILINNIAAIEQNPHAPGLRAPTAQELQQALQKVGT